MWTETQDEAVEYVELCVVVDSINGYWVDSEDEICIIINGTVYYVMNQVAVHKFLTSYFKPIKL
jgi:hypothetical protein